MLIKIKDGSDQNSAGDELPFHGNDQRQVLEKVKEKVFIQQSLQKGAAHTKNAKAEARFSMLIPAGQKKQVNAQSQENANDNSALDGLHGLKIIDGFRRAKIQAFDQPAVATVIVGDMNSDQKVAGLRIQKANLWLPNAFFRIPRGAKDANLTGQLPIAIKPVRSEVKARIKSRRITISEVPIERIDPRTSLPFI